MSPPEQPERIERIDALFHEAADQADPVAYLDQRYPDEDPQVLREVRSLLAADRDATDDWPPLFPGLAERLVHSLKPDPRVGTKIGKYEIVRRLGCGGMGVVYLARARAPDRLLALKVIHRGMNTEEMLRRFQREKLILAGLKHPGIAQFVDSGETPEGGPFFVMEYVEGTPLSEYCDGRSLSIRDRLRLFQEVCRVVESAHQHGVIHRDLKPSHVLIDANGNPKLIDFGIAKLTGPSLGAGGDPPTVPGLQRMSPAYTSPEQLRGEPATTLMDVYSLGVVLNELLTGDRPFFTAEEDFESLKKAVLNDRPHTPSTLFDVRERTGASPAESEGIVQQIAERRDATPDELRQLLAGEPDAILLKALARNPQDRYASCNEFAQDIENHLSGGEVVAYRYNPGERFRKFVRRNRSALTVAALLLGVLLLGLAGTTAGMILARRGYAAARAAEQKALEERDKAEQARMAEETLRREVSKRLRWLLTELPSQLEDPQLRTMVLEAARPWLNDPDSPVGTEKDFDLLKVAWYTQAAIVHRSQEQHEQALATIDQGLQACNRHLAFKPDAQATQVLRVWLWSYRAQSLLRLDRPAETAKYLELASGELGVLSADDPSHAELISVIGSLWLDLAASTNGSETESLSYYQEADLLLSRARQLQPSSPKIGRRHFDGKRALGNCYRGRGELDNARKAFAGGLDAAQNLYRAEDPLSAGRLFLSLTDLAAISQKDDSDALADYYQRAVELAPESRFEDADDEARGYTNLGKAADNLGHWQEASRFFDKSIRLFENQLLEEELPSAQALLEVQIASSSLALVLDYLRLDDQAGAREAMKRVTRLVEEMRTPQWQAKADPAVRALSADVSNLAKKAAEISPALLDRQ